MALAFFFGWLVVLYAGADHPPPPGFLALVLLDLGAAWVVYLRVPVYARWQRARRPGRWLRVLFEGVVAGLLVANPTSSCTYTVMLAETARPLAPLHGPQG